MQPINRRHTHTPPPPLLLLRGGDMRIDRIAAKPGKWRTFSKGLKGGGGRACRQLFRDDHNFSTLLILDETQLFLWKSGERKERERISNKTEERRKKGERGWLKSFNPSTSGGGNGSKHEARKTIKIGASWMASRHQPGVRWTRGWPSLPPLLFFPLAERTGGEGMGWAFPRDKEGVKIREGVGCCDGELVHRYFDSCRCPSIIRATLPVPLVFFYFFFFPFLSFSFFPPSPSLCPPLSCIGPLTTRLVGVDGVWAWRSV